MKVGQYKHVRLWLREAQLRVVVGFVKQLMKICMTL